MKVNPRRILILSLGAAFLVAVHGIVLYVAFLHAVLPGAALAGVIILVVLKHLGFLSPLYALLRRRH
jgi:hypothetical protein